MGLASLVHCIKKQPLRFNEHIEVSNECKKFLMRCLDKNLNSRPTIRELMIDPWLAEGSRQLVIRSLTIETLQKCVCA